MEFTSVLKNQASEQAKYMIGGMAAATIESSLFGTTYSMLGYYALNTTNGIYSAYKTLAQHSWQWLHARNTPEVDQKTFETASLNNDKIIDADYHFLAKHLCDDHMNRQELKEFLKAFPALDLSDFAPLSYGENLKVPSEKGLHKHFALACNALAPEEKKAIMGILKDIHDAQVIPEERTAGEEIPPQYIATSRKAEIIRSSLQLAMTSLSLITVGLLAYTQYHKTAQNFASSLQPNSSPYGIQDQCDANAWISPGVTSYFSTALRFGFNAIHTVNVLGMCYDWHKKKTLGFGMSTYLALSGLFYSIPSAMSDPRHIFNPVDWTYNTLAAGYFGSGALTRAGTVAALMPYTIWELSHKEAENFSNEEVFQNDLNNAGLGALNIINTQMFFSQMMHLYENTASLFNRGWNCLVMDQFLAPLPPPEKQLVVYKEDPVWSSVIWSSVKRQMRPWRTYYTWTKPLIENRLVLRKS